MPYNGDLDKLAQLGTVAKLNPDWLLFAEFAERRAKGIRSEAFDTLVRFLDLAVSWPFPKRLEFTKWLCPESRKFYDSTIVMPHPVSTRFIVPTVLEWTELEPRNAEPQLWLGLLGGDISHLKCALEFDPFCNLARWTLANRFLAPISQNQDHMPDLYINDPRQDLRTLEEVGALISEGLNDAQTTFLRQEITEYRQVAEAWLAAHPDEGDFAR